MACRLFGTIWTKAGLSLIEPLETIFKEILEYNTFDTKNDFENVVCKMVTILARPQCDNRLIRCPSLVFMSSHCNVLYWVLKVSKCRLVADHLQVHLSPCVIHWATIDSWLVPIKVFPCLAMYVCQEWLLKIPQNLLGKNIQTMSGEWCIWFIFIFYFEWYLIKILIMVVWISILYTQSLSQYGSYWMHSIRQIYFRAQWIVIYQDNIWPAVGIES